jgi:hypothetical protein
LNDHFNGAGHKANVAAARTRRLDGEGGPLEPIPHRRLDQLVKEFRTLLWMVQKRVPPSLFPSLREIMEMNGVHFPDLQSGNLKYTSPDFVAQAIQAMSDETRFQVTEIDVLTCFVHIPILIFAVV